MKYRKKKKITNICLYDKQANKGDDKMKTKTKCILIISGIFIVFSLYFIEGIYVIYTILHLN